MSDAEERAAAQPRLTPYELVFTELFETEVFPRIEAEGAAHDVDPLHPDHFPLLRAVGEAVRDVVPEEAPPEALEQYRALLYHAFCFWRYGKRLYLLDPPLARFLIEAEPAFEQWELAFPHPAFYLQLPTNLFWGSISPDATPEPVDGFFVSSSTADDPLGVPFQRVGILAVLGIRRNRAGFSVIPFDTEAGPGITAEWLSGEGREGGGDFKSSLPGGEMAGLYSILTVREVLKLLGRCFWYIDQFSEDVMLAEATEVTPVEEDGALPPPRLEYFRVTLGQGDSEGS
jgi:hypothetical protein